MMSSVKISATLLSSLVGVCLPQSVCAEEQPPLERNEQAGSHQSGYGDSEVFGGPSAVSSELDTLDENRDSLYQLDILTRGLNPWFEWKQARKRENGLKLGVNALFLYQHASEKSTDEEQKHAAGGIYRFQGSWGAFSDDSGNSGKIEWRLEARSAIGGDPSPQQFGGQYAAALNTGFPYGNDFDIDLAVINWAQIFGNGRAGFVAGRLAFDAYLDAFAFQSPYRGFLNRSFIFNPTVATTGAGALGTVLKGFITDQIWLGAQIYDGNAANGKFDLDTFGEHEWLKAVEIGWTPAIERRGTDRVQFTYWEKDARRKAGIPAGSGWAISASNQWTENTLAFLRVGHSDGGAGVAAENALSLGLEYSPWTDRTWALGAGWAEPSTQSHGRGLDDEYVLETSYKLQLTKNFSVTPDLQLLFNPAKTPEQDHLWMFGLRAILTL